MVFAGTLVLAAGASYLGVKMVKVHAMEAPRANRQTEAVVDATNAFLKSLSAEQRQKVMFAFTPGKSATIAHFHRTQDGGVAPGVPAGNGRLQGPPPQGDHPMHDQHAGPPPDGKGPGGPGGSGGPGFGMGPAGGFVGEQYGQAVWSNYPVSDVLRPGLRLGTLSAAQRAAAMHLLQTVLSPMGYQKVLDIMGSDQALTDAGTNFASGEAVYTIGIFGEPSTGKPWMLEFGGHHLGLNIVIAGPSGIMTPTLTGAQPSIYKHGEQTVRVLAKENDTAFALLDALDAGQKKKAILNYEVNDLVLGPGHAGETIQPEGIKGSDLNDRQRAMLLDVIAQWAGIVNDAYAKPRLGEIQADLNDTYFAWSGPTTHEPGKNGGSYYRIQGPKVIVEFSPQGVGGDPTMHVHTIYRDPTNDYGVKITGAE
ncbi:hypothetical protein GCM10011586_00820 [Silvibacterium dinghuense]|nr:hypothetical protein GCM10011586_00820 [Silvibacterium dinghuense]